MDTQLTEKMEFVAAFGLRSCSWQTVLATILKRLRNWWYPTPYTRRRIDTPDGYFLDTIHYNGHLGADTPIVLLVHGLGGTGRSPYVVEAARQLGQRGIRSIAINSRGANRYAVEQGRTTGKLYHAGEVHDLAFLLNEFHREDPAAPLGLIGFSLGACRSLNMIGRADLDAETSKTVPLDENELRPVSLPPTFVGCVAISPPLDLDKGMTVLEQPKAKVWHKYLLDGIFVWMDNIKGSIAPDAISKVDRASTALSIREFDDILVAPLHGFASAADYYAKCSPARCLAAIRRPTLLIRARDDPFLWPGDCDTPALTGNPNITALLPQNGGHIGFVSWQGLRLMPWAEITAAKWMAAQFARQKTSAGAAAGAAGAAAN